MAGEATTGRWILDARHTEASTRQVGTYTKVWVGFVAFSVALFGVHWRNAGLNGMASRFPWQGVMLSWPLSVVVLYLLVGRSETLPAAVFDRLLSSKAAYVRRCRSRTVLSHNGLATVFRSLVLTNVLSLALPLAIKEPQQASTATRLLKFAAWGACVVTIAVSATVLGLIQSQAPIEFTFLQPQSETAAKPNDEDDSTHPEMNIEPADRPITKYISLLKPGQWMLIAATSRRHNVWVRLNHSTTDSKTLDLTTSLASDHPLFDSKTTQTLKPQLSAVHKSAS